VEFRENPKRFVNLSVFSIGSGKKSSDSGYSIVVEVSESPLPLNAKIYLK
jgi:phospholipid/cholesterol/gamma-HCH transport system substrate-binding protein